MYSIHKHHPPKNMDKCTVYVYTCGGCSTFSFDSQRTQNSHSISTSLVLIGFQLIPVSNHDPCRLIENGTRQLPDLFKRAQVATSKVTAVSICFNAKSPFAIFFGLKDVPFFFGSKDVDDVESMV